MTPETAERKEASARARTCRASDGRRIKVSKRGHGATRLERLPALAVLVSTVTSPRLTLK